MVAEHRQHGDLQITHRVGHDRGLLGLAVGGEVAGQEHEVGALVQPREGLRRTGAVVARSMSPAAAIRIRHSSWWSAGRPSVTMVELMHCGYPLTRGG